MIDIWELFQQEFKNGDDVIVIHSDSKLYGGKLKATKDSCMVGSKEFSWNVIVFIGHDGFPCRPLHTWLENEELDKIENEDSIILMRKLLTKKPKEKIITKIVSNTEPAPITSRRRYDSYCGGCPFEFQEVELQIINPFGGTLLQKDYFRTKNDYSETLLHRSKDGAVGMLWELEKEVIEFYN